MFSTVWAPLYYLYSFILNLNPLLPAAEDSVAQTSSVSLPPVISSSWNVTAFSPAQYSWPSCSWSLLSSYYFPSFFHSSCQALNMWWLRASLLPPDSLFINRVTLTGPLSSSLLGPLAQQQSSSGLPQICSSHYHCRHHAFLPSSVGF